MASKKLKSYFEFSLAEKNRMNGLCKLCHHNYKDLHGIYSNFVKHLKRKHLSEYQKSFSIYTNDDDDLLLEDDIDSCDEHHQLSNDLTSQINSKQNRINFSVAKNLIIKCNLPLNVIENPAFREFIKECYSKWQPISTKKLKSDILSSINKRIYKIIYETLQEINHLTLTIDAWSDRRSRGFLGVTCHFIDDNMVPQAFLIDFIRIKSPYTSENIQRLTEHVLDRFNIKEKVYRIITDNASSMIKAYKFGLVVTVDEDDDDHSIDNVENQKSTTTTNDYFKFDNNDQNFDCNNFQIVNQLESSSVIIHEQESIQAPVRLSCFAHTLQLTIRDGLQKNPYVSKVLEKCEMFARFAHKSSKIADLLDQINKHINKPNVTRWNSDYMLIKSILSINRGELEAISNLMENVIQFSSNDFTIMEEIVDILEPFYQISLKCQADKVVTISLVVPAIVHLVCHLRSIHKNLSFCHQLIEQLQSSIERRFAGIINQLYQQGVKSNDPFNDPIYFMTTVLDPSFKFFWIHDLKLPMNIENRLKQSIIQLILDEITKDLQSKAAAAAATTTTTRTTATISSPHERDSSSNQSSSSAFLSANKSKRIKLFVYDDEYYDHKKNLTNSTTTMCNPSLELEAYLQDPIRSNFSDYWLRSRLTSLKKLVTRIFSVQASSAPIERVFSHAGLIFSSRRTRLNEQLFRDIVFLKANQCLL